jgi:hypothetical protein
MVRYRSVVRSAAVEPSGMRTRTNAYRRIPARYSVVKAKRTPATQGPRADRWAQP